MNVVVIGGGNAGVIDAVYFCESGFDVSVIESDKSKFKDLQDDTLQFSERGVINIFSRFKKGGQLRIFRRYSDYNETPDVVIISDAKVIREGVGGPAFLGDSIEWISTVLKRTSYTMIVMKVDIRLGIYHLIRDNITLKRPDLIAGEHYDIIMNPSFVGEDADIRDITIPDRIVIGTGGKSAKIQKAISRLYATAIDAGTPVFYTDCKTVCFIKYASIAFEFAHISLLNEMIDLCCKFGGNVEDMIDGLLIDPKICKGALRVPAGFCESSGVKALEYLMELNSSSCLNLCTLNSIERSNKQRLSKIARKIEVLIQEKNSIQNKKIAVLGLSFKSSDVLMSPSIFLINHLLGRGADVSAYDPLFMPNSTLSRKIPADIMKNVSFSLSGSPYDAVERSDIVVITADRPGFRSLDICTMRKLMNGSEFKKPVVFDLIGALCEKKWEDVTYIAHDIELHSDALR